jgi:hypothetical protein
MDRQDCKKQLVFDDFKEHALLAAPKRSDGIEPFEYAWKERLYSAPLRN